MPLLSPSTNPFSSPKEVWITAFNQLKRIRRYFIRPEPHQRVLVYMQRLMSSTERKNGWQVAEEVGEVTSYVMQHLLDRAKWDCDRIQDKLRTYVRETLADPKGVLAIDETGFLKKGCKSVGVQRQYSGTAERIENCQKEMHQKSLSRRPRCQSQQQPFPFKPTCLLISPSWFP